MRVLMAFTLIACCGISLAQTTLDADAENSVGRLMSHAEDGTYTSWDQKDLNRLGDVAAVSLTKVVAGKNLRPSEIRQALLIITLSFNVPRLITRESDKTPRTAMFVLRYLEHLTIDPDLRHKIQETEASFEKGVP